MAKSTFFKPTQARPLVRALFDPRSDVRIAAFGALIRLPLAPSDWVQVGTYASWALGMSESTAERLAVIDASPYLPLPSIRDLVARAAQEGRREAKSRARDAALKFPDPPTLLGAIREGGSESEEAAQRLAAADLSQSLDAVRSQVRAVPRNSDVRLWLALGLARFGVDHELKALFEELRQGRHYPFADQYSATLADLSAWTLGSAHWYVALRNVLGGLRLPAPTHGWLSAIAATSEASQARSLATALLESFDTSFLDPPLARGDGVRFITPSPAARRRVNRELPRLYNESSRRVVQDDPEDWFSSTLSEHVMTPALEGDLAPAIITALFRRADRAWDINLGNSTVRWVQAHQANFRPDLDGLFREYWRLSVREIARWRLPSDDAAVGFFTGDDESLYRWLCWQIAWTASRGGLRGLVTGLAAHFQSSKPTERKAAAWLMADAADYITQPNGPRFGGGSGPTRRVATQGVAEEVDRLVAAGEAGPARKDVVRGAYLYKVWYGTTRAPVDPADPSRGFTNNRDSGGTIRFGTCTVQVPRAHKFGSTGTTLYRRVLRLRFSDDHLKIVGRTAIDPTDFFPSLHGQLADLEEADRMLLVYLHGYNVSFDEAAIRTAQIGFDLKVPGATAFFSWPSVGSARAYLADADRITASETQIADFLTRASTATGARAVHIIAHSMGNRGLARAIQRITAKASARGGVRFGQIVLAAPDIEATIFRDLAAIYPSISEHTTMYVSARDRALGLSRWLQQSDRAGYTPPVTVVPEIDTIEVADIDLTMLGHAYYAEAAPILYDISALLRHNEPPSQRPRLESAGDPTARYWTIRA